MRVGIIKLEIHIFSCHSLKEKRTVLKRILKRLTDKYNVSVAEVGYQDKWQRSCLAIACVGNNIDLVHSTLDSVQDLVERNLAGYIISSEKEILI